MLKSLSLAAGVLSAASSAQAQDILPFPLVPVAPGPVAGSTDFELDRAIIDLLASEDAVILEGFASPHGSIYDLDLTRIRFDFSSIGVYVDGDKSQWDPGNLSLWKGSAVGVPGSDVFMAFSSLGSYGWVYDGLEYTHLSATTPASGDWNESGARIFSDRALRATGERDRSILCMSDELISGPTRGSESALFGGGDTLTPGMTLECKIAIETDYQLFQIWGNLTAEQNYVMALLGAASDRYLSQVDVILTYPYVQFYTNSNDPWSSQDNGGNSVDLLYEFRNAWQNNIPGGAHLASFVSGAGLGGGVAWLDVLCNGNYGFAVSGNINGGLDFPVNQGNNTWDFVVLTHEIGHNFGTPHTHDYCPPVDECAPNGYFGQCQNSQQCINNGTIMGYCHLCSGGMNNVTTYFHPTVINTMRAEADNSCLPDYDGGGGGPTTLLYENWESGSLGSWSGSNGKRVKVAGGAAYNGSYGARLKKGGQGTSACTVGTTTKQSWLESPVINASGYSNIEVSLFAKCNANELACEYVEIQYNVGSGWVTLTTYEDQSWNQIALTLPSDADNASNLQLRLRTNMKGKYERVDLDDVTVIGN